MNLTDEDRKRLTELLGECWHDCTDDFPSNVCQKCGWTLGKTARPNRTFTSPADVFDVKDALEKAGKWKKFFQSTWKPWMEYDGFSGSEAAYFSWLFRTVNEQGEAHFCGLVSQWLKEVGK